MNLKHLLMLYLGRHPHEYIWYFFDSKILKIILNLIPSIVLIVLDLIPGLEGIKLCSVLGAQKSCSKHEIQQFSLHMHMLIPLKNILIMKKVKTILI